jgi:hypothetical protein
MPLHLLNSTASHLRKKTLRADKAGFPVNSYGVDYFSGSPDGYFPDRCAKAESAKWPWHASDIRRHQPCKEGALDFLPAVKLFLARFEDISRG